MSANRSSRQRRRPLPPGQTLYTPGSSPARRSLEQRSAAPMVFLYQLPVWLLPLIAVALLITGLAVHGVDHHLDRFFRQLFGHFGAAAA